MKYIYLLTSLLFFTFSSCLKAQNTEENTLPKYRRSSLCTILMESERFPMKDTVMKAYYDAPFPDKYNDHSVGIKSFDPKRYPVSDEDRAAAGIKMSFGRNLDKELRAQNPNGNNDPASYDDTLIIRKFFNDQKVANKLIAKWFNRQEDGSFNIDLISERGLFDASFIDTKTAFASSDGVSLLKTAGLDLVYNTFVVVSKMNFVSNEIAAALIRESAKLAAKEIKNQLLQAAAMAAADIAYNKAKEGYSVWTTSHLYQLVWNDSIQYTFYNDLYMDAGNADPAKKEKFDNTDLFQLKYIGSEKSVSLVTFSLKTKRTEEQIVKLSTIRNIDAVYAKLQKKYDVFMPKTPLYTGYPITAKIGMKEGLEGGEKFEVFEQVMDSKTGVIELKSLGKIVVDKNLIWDNRYSLGTDDPDNGNKKKQQALDRTTFKGGKDYYPGLLIKQVK
jgi:hypothetical protein